MSAIRAAAAFVSLELRQSAFTKGLRSAERSLANTGKKLRSIGTATLGIGAAAITGFTGAVSRASDLSEAVSKSSNVFGEAASMVNKFAETSASAFGISKRAANEYASELGLILLKSGSTQAESAKMSLSLTRLAADIASLNNISIDEALTKLKAGLVGSSEPLRTVGVLLSANAVNAKAAELGLEKVNGQYTEGSKVAARYALILEQTKETQGDFARTSTGLANTNRRILATFENLIAKVGGALLPIYESVANSISQMITPVTEFIAEHEELTRNLFIGAAALAGVGIVLGTVGAAFSALAFIVGGLTTAMGLLTTVMGAYRTASLIVAAVTTANSGAMTFLTASITSATVATIALTAALGGLALGGGAAFGAWISGAIDDYREFNKQTRIAKELSGDLEDVFARRQSNFLGRVNEQTTDQGKDKLLGPEIARQQKELADKEAQVQGLRRQVAKAQEDTPRSFLTTNLENNLKLEEAALKKQKARLQELVTIKDSLFAKKDTKDVPVPSKDTEAIAGQKSINDSFEQQINSIRQRNIELERGNEAAERFADAQSGFSKEQQRQLAMARAKTRELERQAEAEEEAKQKKEAEQNERDAKKESIDNSFKSQIRALQVRGIRATKGEEAAQLRQDQIAGFSEEQIANLQNLRARVKRDEEEAKLAGNIGEGQDKIKSQGSFVGAAVAQSSGSISSQMLMLQKQQLEQDKKREAKRIKRAKEQLEATKANKPPETTAVK